MDLSRAQIRAWIEGILAKTGDTPSALARKAGLATTTLTRFMNSDDAALPSLTTLAKIAHAAGEPSPSLGPEPMHALPDGLRDTVPPDYEIEPAPKTDPLIDQILQEFPAAAPWRVRTRLLDAIGYIPGDTIIVDLNARPDPGDVVCAQVYDWNSRTAETVIRIFEPPYLIVATSDAALAEMYRKPVYIDNERVILKGVCVASIRRTRSPAAKSDPAKP